MSFKKFILLVCISVSPVSPVFSSDEPMPAFAGKHSHNEEDTAAIEVIIEEFKRAIKEKDGPALGALFLYDDIFFQPAPSKEILNQIRSERDPDFLKKPPVGRAQRFVKFISENTHDLEERFYNVKITQDKEFSLVVFDFEFIMDGSVTNYGIEVWQMFKVDGDWRIATVAWSSTRPIG